MTHDFMKMALETLGYRVSTFAACYFSASVDLLHVRPTWRVVLQLSLSARRGLEHCLIMLRGFALLADREWAA